MTRPAGTDKKVTLSDVAKSADVAPMTVSRYLNGHPNISEKTRKKVAAAIKRLNYTPNLAARILMGQPSNTVGLIVPNLSDPFFAEVAHNVQAFARTRGKLVWVAATDGDRVVEAELLEQMRQHHVDGLLLVPTDPAVLAPPDIPLVVLDRPLTTSCETILVDNRGGAAKAVEHLVWHGYKRILCASVDLVDVYTIGERIAGYQDVMRRHGYPIAVRSGLQTRDEMARAIEEASTAEGRPEAIFCTNNVTTLHLLEVLLDRQVAIPDQIAVIGFDDFEFAPLMRPGITVIRQSAADLGYQAAHRLFERIAQTDSRVASLTTTLPTSLVVRASCGCASPRRE